MERSPFFGLRKRASYRSTRMPHVIRFEKSIDAEFLLASPDLGMEITTSLPMMHLLQLYDPRLLNEKFRNVYRDQEVRPLHCLRDNAGTQVSSQVL
jgi:hypothetical protein